MKTSNLAWCMLSIICVCIITGAVTQPDCWDKKYTIDSCQKVFCPPWKRCVDGKCICKLPYQCPKNKTMGVCSDGSRTFLNYCQLKSAECTNSKYRFSSESPCARGVFELSLEKTDGGATNKNGAVKIKLAKQNSKFFVCSEKWSVTEANVACKQLGFPQGAYSEGLRRNISEDIETHPECLQVTCRGFESTLAECTIRKGKSTNNERAAVLCYDENNDCQDQFTCVNKKCIPFDNMCNGQNDCGDLSDELCCTKCTDSFHCGSGTCIPFHYLCNGDVDCVSGEDEANCSGPPAEKKEILATRTDDHNGPPEEKKEILATGVDDHNVGSLAVDFNIEEERRLIWDSIPRPTCGIPKEEHIRVKRIIGGHKAEKNQFPWQVAIKDNSKVNCGGIYIGGCWVLTAAHCVRSDQAHRYRIIIELLDRLAYDKDIDSFPVKNVKVHELYNPNTYENDIALLEVVNIYNNPSCMQVDNNLVAACVPWSPYQFKAGDTCTVSGWGRAEGLSKVFHLKWGHINLMDNCSTVYKERFFDKMECAGTYDGSIDACKGDSGGPLICQDSQGVAYVWGIVSWGENCGEAGYPGVYTKVAHYFEWISRHVGRQLISKHNI